MARLPIGVSIRSIRSEPRWWLDAARRLDEAGYSGVWCWDHFIGRGDRTVPVIEAWTILSAAAATTSRVTVGTFVVNVMNRHPAVLARMASTLQIVSGGRLILGIGIGGHPAEHEALGIPFPEAPERVARVEEAVAVLRALWTGGPVTRPSAFYPLVDAYARPIADPLPRIVLGGESARGAQLAGRIADGWTAFETNFEANLTIYLEALAAAGKERADQLVLVGFEGEWLDDGTLVGTPWIDDPRATWERWREAGADGAIVTAKSEADIVALVEAVARW
jgi:alkanesulfonate monooxygenase SsuD/methylene tetrahydromethanopterin reductase-like flavin-dependent oxidoreductase (luciferase family)